MGCGVLRSARIVTYPNIVVVGSSPSGPWWPFLAWRINRDVYASYTRNRFLVFVGPMVFPFFRIGIKFSRSPRKAPAVPLQYLPVLHRKGLNGFRLGLVMCYSRSGHRHTQSSSTSRHRGHRSHCDRRVACTWCAGSNGVQYGGVIEICEVP